MAGSNRLAMSASVLLLLAGSLAVGSAQTYGQQDGNTPPPVSPGTTTDPTNPNPVPTALVPEGPTGTLPDSPSPPGVTTATGIEEGSSGDPGTGAGSGASSASGGP
jgi:hypothetical protein